MIEIDKLARQKKTHEKRAETYQLQCGNVNELENYY